MCLSSITQNSQIYDFFIYFALFFGMLAIDEDLLLMKIVLYGWNANFQLNCEMEVLE